MTTASLERLEACHVALIAALDAQDVDALEGMLGDFRDAVDTVRAQGGWRADPSVQGKVARVAALADAARLRVNFLTDRNRQRLERLASVDGRGPSAVYGRTGRSR